MVVQKVSDISRRVGPFAVTNTSHELILQLENRGELNWIVCLSLVFTMGTVLALGMLSILQPVQDSRSRFTSDDPMHLFAPSENHMAFLWIVATGLMLIFVPYIVNRAYKASIRFRFNKTENAFFKDRRRITRLDKIEHVLLHETKDPDSRYIYRMYIVYGDGNQLFLHNGYNEREIMNLANTVSVFVHCPVKWR
jgi:hypothetical protein